MNSIVNSNSSGGNSVAPSQSNGGFSPEMMQQFQQFKSTFKGNPQQMVMQMLSQGKIGNGQVQQAMQMAKQFQGMMK